MNKRKCDCCGKIEEVVVLASGVGPISFAYCDRCAKEGYEPYGAILATFATIADSYYDIGGNHKAFLDKNLKFYNKSVEDFDRELSETAETLLEVDTTPMTDEDEQLIQLQIEVYELRQELDRIRTVVKSKYDPEVIKSHWRETGNYDDAYEYGVTNGTTNTLYEMVKLLGIDANPPIDIEID